MYWWHHGFHEPEADVKLEWPLLKRVFGYFLPYWSLALVVLVCIGAAAALGLVPAIVTQHLINYLTGRQSVGSATIFTLVNTAVILASTVLLIFALDWKLTVAALVVLPAFLLPPRRVGNATFQARKATQGKLAELTAYMQETLGISGMQLVKAFVKQRAETLRFAKLNDELRALNIRQSMIGRWFFMLMSILGTAGPAVLWLFGGYLVVTGQESLGTVVTFATVLLTRLYGPVGSLANMQVNVVGSLALFQRIFEYMDLPVEIDERPQATVLNEARGEVEFEHVTFRYPSGDRPALKEV